MRLGNKFFYILFTFFIFIEIIFAEEKITTSPLINIEKIKPSFEDFEEITVNNTSSQNLKKKKKA